MGWDDSLPKTPDTVYRRVTWPKGHWKKIYTKDWPFTHFETYDEELEFVQSQNPYSIWTLVCAEDEYYIVPGFRWVNRENYFVTEKPFTDENLHDEYLVI